MLNKLLAHSQEFHYSSLSFAWTGPTLILSNHREIAQVKQVTLADAQQDRNSFQKEVVLSSYGILFIAINSPWQECLTIAHNAHFGRASDRASRRLGLGHHPTKMAAAADESEPTHWCPLADRKMQSGTSLLTRCQAPFHISLKAKINLLTKWWHFWSLCPHSQTSMEGKEIHAAWI